MRSDERVSSRRPRDRWRSRIGIIGSLLIAAFVASAAVDAWRLHRQIVTVNDREIRNLVTALAGGTARDLQAVDARMRDIAMSWQAGRRDGLADAPGDERSVARWFALYDRSGHLVAASSRARAPETDVSKRRDFIRQRDDRPVGIAVDAEPVPADGGVIALSRRIDDASGGFAGIVVASIDLQRLHDGYRGVTLGAGAALLLLADDGTVLVEEPRETRVARDPKEPYLVALASGSGVDRVVTPIDGRRKLVASRAIDGAPLTLALTRDDEAARAPWYDELRSAIVRTGLLTMLILLSMMVLRRQVRHLENSERALRASEERYAMAMAAASEGHAEWNRTEGTLFLSAQWRALHGIDPSSVITDVMDVVRLVTIHPDDSERLHHLVRQHAEGSMPTFEAEYRVIGPQAGTSWVYTRGQRIIDVDGANRSFCASIDITPRKTAEEENARLNERLEQSRKLEALGTFAGGVAHDFNNILGAILGYGEMAQEESSPGSSLRRHLDRVMQSGSRARLLVRRILDFSRGGVAERVPVEFRAIVEEVVTMLMPALPEGVEVITRLEATSATVRGDPTQLHQVVMNLCVNAVQAIDEAGTLEVSLSRHDAEGDARRLTGVLRAGSYVRLDVGDTGAGIAPTLIDKVFDPFFTTKAAGTGTGLGLSVVYGVVSDLGGAIDIRARQPKGTVVSVWLPFDGDAAPHVAAHHDVRMRGRGQVVMVVDDERSLVELIEEWLASSGYEPVGYASAEAAWAAFESDPDRFDVLVTDDALPGVGGRELVRRALRLRPTLPVVLVSGNLDDAAEREATSLGVGALLHKPLVRQDLLRTLARLMLRDRNDPR